MDVVMAVSSTLKGFLHEHFDRSAIAPARQDSSALLEFYTTIHMVVITITPYLVRSGHPISTKAVQHAERVQYPNRLQASANIHIVSIVAQQL